MLSELLQIRPGLTAIIGSGGKTSLLLALAAQLRRRNRVIVCTSTKIYPPADFPLLLSDDGAALSRLLEEQGAVCAGSLLPGGKLGPSALPFEALCRAAAYVLVEADGSAGLPLKAHLPHEPVIPPQTQQTILLLGLSGLGQRISAAAHRKELYAQRAGVTEETEVTPALAARVLLAEGLGDRVFLNQADNEESMEQARQLAAFLPCPVAAGSLRKEWYQCLR